MNFADFKNLDEIDSKIIKLLSENARLSYVAIGKKVNLSRVAAKARVQALEERGVIEGYYTILNPQKISDSISCFFDMEVEPCDFHEVVAALKECGYITQIYQVSGNSKLHVHAVIPGNDAMDAFLSQVINRLPGIRKQCCDIILSRIKDEKGLRL